MRDHVGADTLALYVMGELERDVVDGIEAHVDQCPLCAAEVAREAGLELVMRRAGAEFRVAETARSGGRRRMWGLVSLVVAAAAILAAVTFPQVMPEVATSATSIASRAGMDSRIGLNAGREPTARIRNADACLRGCGAPQK